MPNLHNEEIRAMQNTLSFIKKRIALETSQSKKEKLKRDAKELEELIMTKLNETNDFNDVRLEEDIY